MTATTTPTLAENCIQRTARKHYRCHCADEVWSWRVFSIKTGDPADWDHSGERGSYPTREAAQAAADAMVGSPAGFNMHLPEHPASSWYTQAWPEPRVNPDYTLRSPDCRGDIAPGDRYVEYVGEAMPYESGHRYCQPCGVAIWLR